MTTVEMRNLAGARWVWKILCCLTGGAIMVKTALTPVPEFSNLSEFTAPVASVEEADRRGQDRRLEIRFEGRHGTYLVPEWIPNRDAVKNGLLPGTKVRVWSDVGRGYVLWQIQSDGRRLVSYDETSRVMAGRRWFAGGLGGLLLLLPVALWGLEVAKHRRLLRKIKGADQARSNRMDG